MFLLSEFLFSNLFLPYRGRNLCASLFGKFTVFHSLLQREFKTLNCWVSSFFGKLQWKIQPQQFPDCWYFPWISSLLFSINVVMIPLKSSWQPLQSYLFPTFWIRGETGFVFCKRLANLETNSTLILLHEEAKSQFLLPLDGMLVHRRSLPCNVF